MIKTINKQIKNVFIGEILQSEEVQQNHFLMKVALPLSFASPCPGQFVMIKVAGLNEPFLGRPISIYSFSRKKSFCTLELLFRVVGKGTEILAGLIKGSQVEIHGPLGGCFAIYPDKKNIIFIAGGIGVAPLSLLAEYLCRDVCLPESVLNFYLGAQTKTAVVGLDKISKLCYNVHVCTDNGTMGEKALVTQAFQKDIKKYSPHETIIYACGPRVMLKALHKLLAGSDFPCQVSLEERMACGTGACMGCAVAVKDKAGEMSYQRVCSDGPVFDIQQVIWEDK